ncbi:hypothetical protein PACILC2_28270 [Paenibacillus cisolokensis]|uniref:Phosphoserine aminotransferase n=1 Tax=Paenibacillus cisolokensis TaxID=1658519 RepID=A0ABQ4N7T8_9BACL|nr:hypothetical protein PACILC2_28270 [Paenibacillus cisolokensis]
MTQRAYNFNAGPAALPLDVLKQAQEQFVDFNGAGMSIMEMSHRSAQYEQVHEETASLMRELFGIPDNYHVLFLQGGASTQFAMLPMNLLRPGRPGAYIMTGSWADKALKEAKLIGETAIAASTEGDRFTRMPDSSEIRIPEHAAYVHLTSNETIEGTQYAVYPDTGSVPLVADMSSDILSRPVDVSQFGVIYAGAQKISALRASPSSLFATIWRRRAQKACRRCCGTARMRKTARSTIRRRRSRSIWSIWC